LLQGNPAALRLGTQDGHHALIQLANQDLSHSRLRCYQPCYRPVVNPTGSALRPPPNG
jgi:hypothetical protein